MVYCPLRKVFAIKLAASIKQIQLLDSRPYNKWGAGGVLTVWFENRVVSW